MSREHAAGGAFGIDHRLPLDESGVWARSKQTAVQNLSALTIVGAESNESRLGRDVLSAAVLKVATHRPRPSQLEANGRH